MWNEEKDDRMVTYSTQNRYRASILIRIIRFFNTVLYFAKNWSRVAKKKNHIKNDHLSEISMFQD